MTAAMDQARAIADAVLYEGYLLYPYRASAAKNRVRWQWGVLMPPSYAATGTGERSSCLTELLAEPGDGAALHVRLRFLHLQARIVEVAGPRGFRPVPSVIAAGTEYLSWDEAVEHEVDAVLPFPSLVSDSLDAGGATVPFHVDGGEEVEPAPGGDERGAAVRIVRRRQPLDGVLRLRAEPLPGPFGGFRLRLRVANASAWRRPDAARADALPHALIAAHTLLSLSAGSFLSTVDPPEWAAAPAKACQADGAWPVLVGGPGERDTVLCSPIILYDHPAIAPESAGNLFDGTEIDEILTLRTMTLTDEEKREARATDERAAELLDRVDTLPPELLERLHGTVRYLRSVTGPGTNASPAASTDLSMDIGTAMSTDLSTGPAAVPASPEVPWWDPGADTSVSPETDSVVVAGVAVCKGSRVRLRPGRRADAHDMFVAGKVAVVQAVLLDVDDVRHLAVTLEDDPGAELFAAHGRYRYFGVDEVEPL